MNFAQSGGLDGAVLTSKQFYNTDYTKPLLFLADGAALSNRAMAEHLLGSQWGMMNETGSYPGQVWLWLYTFWYQVKPFQGGQRRHPRDARDGRAEPRVRAYPVHPGRPGYPALDPDLQADLARSLPGRRLSPAPLRGGGPSRRPGS